MKDDCLVVADAEEGPIVSLPHATIVFLHPDRSQLSDLR